MTKTMKLGNCAACNSALAAGWTARDAKDASDLPMSFCLTCGLVQRANMPTAAELATYYATEYRQALKNAVQPKPKRIYRAGRIALGRLDVLKQYVDGGDLLDIGAGGGEFVFLAQQSGFRSRGVEPNEAYGKFARDNYQVDIKTTGIDELEQPACTDIVSMFHVLEHLQEPLSAVERIHQALRPGGLAFIEVPNVDAKDAAPANVYFAAHLLYFNGTTLKQLFARHFECLYLNDEGNLLAVFRRRDQVLVDAPDQPAQLVPEALRLQQLSSRSWTQYLANGGLNKPFNKARQTINELRNTRGRTPREFLLSMHGEKRP